MANVQAQGPATMERLAGSADARGTDYELKMGALLALRMRRAGARFQLFSNAAAARPFDDLVLRVLQPAPALLALQLKHKDPAKHLSAQAFKGDKGDFGLQKYFRLYKEMRSWHDPQRQTPLTEDQRLLIQTPLERVWFVIYTPADVLGADRRPPPAAAMPYLDELHTHPQGQCVAFDAAADQVWQCMSTGPPEDERLFQWGFLPRLRVLCRQSPVEGLDALLEAEVTAVLGRAPPRCDWLTERLLVRVKAWAQGVGVGRGEALTEGDVGFLWEAVGDALRAAGRAVAGAGALRFQDGRCRRLKEFLWIEGADAAGGGAGAGGGGRSHVHVRVPGVPQGQRAAKLLQLLDEHGRERWVYVGDEELREYPLGALQEAAAAAGVAALVVDADQQLDAARALVASMSGRLQVICLSSDHAPGCVAASVEDSAEGSAERPFEDVWALDHLTNETQEKLMDSTILFQGRAVALRALEGAWPGLRRGVGGAMLAALARGRAVALGDAPEQPLAPCLYVPRVLEHPPALDAAVLRALRPDADLLAISGDAQALVEEQRALAAAAAAAAEGTGVEGLAAGLGRDRPHEELSCRLDGGAADIDRVVVQLGARADEASFRAACAARGLGVSVHWAHCVGGGGRRALAWLGSEGRPDALLPFVRPASAACAGGRGPCAHAAGGAERAAAAWAGVGAGSVALLVGEPGMGKTQFLRRVAQEARLRAPCSWTVVVQALAHAALLQRWPAPAELCEAHLLELLAAAAGVAAGAAGEAGRRCLEAALCRSGALHVLVDGVDEVCPAYKHKLLRCLQLLQASRAALVWVATRPEMEAELSEALGCHPCRLRPLSTEQQEAFLCSHWAAADGPAPAPAPSAFQALAAELTDALHGALGRHPQRCLLDVPLYAMMAAEAFQEAAVAALRARGGLLTNRNITLHDLYRRFVQTKRHLYKERYGLNDSKFQILAIPDVFDDIHNNCAMFVLISDGKLEEVDAQPFRDFVRRNEELIARDKNGLLWVHDDGSPHFAHYTLVDFFAARWLVGERGPVARAVWRCLAEGRGGARGLLREFAEQALAEGRPLHEAVLLAHDDGGACALLLTATRAALAQVDAWGRGALHVAAGLGRGGAVAALLAAGADVGAPDALLGWPALRHAAAGRHLAVAERLLAAGARCDHLRLRDPGDALLEAAERGLQRIVGCILQHSHHQIQHEGEQQNGAQTPAGIYQILQLADSAHAHDQPRDQQESAVEKGNLTYVATEHAQETKSRISPESLSILKCDSHKNSALNVACLKGRCGLANQLLAMGAEANARSKAGITPLICALLSGREDVTRLLLQHGADISVGTDDGNTPLHFACVRCNLAVATLLVDAGADVNARNRKGNTPLAVATKSGVAESVQTLFQAQERNAKKLQAVLEHHSAIHGVSVDAMTGLFRSSTADLYRVVELLVARGADVNARDNLGSTALAGTCAGGAVETARLLLQMGALASGGEGGAAFSPLHAASLRGDPAFARLLLAKGCDVNARSRKGSTPLMLAVECGGVDTTRLLLQEGAGATACNAEGNTALHLASLNGDVEIAELLLANGADPNAQNGLGNSPLMLAADCGSLQTVRLLLGKGADIFACNKVKNTSLHFAAKNDRDITQLLIKNGADVNARNLKGTTPLMWAAELGNIETTSLLLECGADVFVCSGSKNTALHLAALKGHNEVAKLLVEKGAEPNAKNTRKNTPLIMAASSGDFETVQQLLHNGADPCAYDVDRNTALHFASNKGHIEVAKLLIEEGADVNARNNKGSTPLIWSAESGKVETVKLLLQNRADVMAWNLERNTALHCAVLNGHHGATKLLLEGGAEVNAQNSKGNAPLVHAAQKGDVEGVELLLQNGANVDVINEGKSTPLYFASFTGRREVVKVLIERGANVNARNQKGSTPLMWASEGGQLDTARLLLQNGADVSVRNKVGHTALHFASTKGQRDVVELLLEQGADVNAASDQGQTALMSAADAGRQQVVQLLLNKGANVSAYSVTKNTALHFSCKRYPEITCMLIENGANINAPNHKGTTPLIWAAEAGSVENTLLLLENRVNVSACDSDRNTALHFAALKGHYEISKLLLEKGADVDGRNVRRITPLMMTAESGNLQIAGLLVEKGADVRASNADGNTALHLAACKDHSAVAILLLELGACVDARNAKGSTPLMWAGEGGGANAARLLLQGGADVLARNADNSTALHAAVLNGHHALASLFLERGAQVNAVNVRGNTPLITAAECGDAKTTQVLLEHGADTSAMNERGYTALHVAAFKGRHHVARLLIQAGAAVNGHSLNQNTPLVLTAHLGNVETARLLLQEGAHVSARNMMGHTALHVASICGKLDIAQLLLESGAEVDACNNEGKTPLLCAVEEGHVEIVRVLLHKGADVFASNKQGKTVMDLVILKDHYLVANELLDNCDVANIKNGRGFTALMKAASQGNVRITELLLDKGADVLARDDGKNTALHFAALKNQHVVVMLLLSNGAQANVTNAFGITPLMCAIESGNMASSQLLLQHGANILAREADGNSALHWACHKNHQEIVVLLICNAARVNTRNKYGITPLMCAAHSGNITTSRQLLQYHAEVLARDKDKNTVLHYASLKGHRKIVRLLLEHGADANAANECGVTPLMAAALEGHKRTVSLLLRGGADVAARDTEGDTALHYASLAGRGKVTSQLLAKGACVGARNRSGDTPLAYALAGGRAGIARLLLRRRGEDRT